MSSSIPLPAASPTPRLLLLAHGSRRAQWARPFEAVLAALRELRPDADVELCFLEAMAPRLPDALERAAGDGCAEVCLVPLFLGSGAHLIDDVTREVGEVCARHPQLRVDVRAPAGDNPLVSRALAAYALQCLGDAAAGG